MVFRALITAFLLLPMISNAQLPTHPKGTFTSAKKAMYRIFKDNRTTLYCGCNFDSHKKVNLSSCNYTVRKSKTRASRTEAEHIVPAHAFGHTRACWREAVCQKSNGKKYKGRKCCQKIDKAYKVMENDLHNLWPAIGEVNGDRGNSSFTVLPELQSSYGACQFKVSFPDNKSEPPNKAKGLVARAYFYMHDTYNLPISSKQEKLFAAWDKTFPPSPWEQQWNQLVLEEEGNNNSYISLWPNSTSKSIHITPQKNKQTVLLNTSKEDITVYPVLKNPGASAGWTNTIHPGMKSAFRASKSMRFMCRAGSHNVSCENVLQVFNESSKKRGAGYWVYENIKAGSKI